MRLLASRHAVAFAPASSLRAESHSVFPMSAPVSNWAISAAKSSLERSHLSKSNMYFCFGSSLVGGPFTDRHNRPVSKPASTPYNNAGRHQKGPFRLRRQLGSMPSSEKTRVGKQHATFAAASGSQDDFFGRLFERVIGWLVVVLHQNSSTSEIKNLRVLSRTERKADFPLEITARERANSAAPCSVFSSSSSLSAPVRSGRCVAPSRSCH